MENASSGAADPKSQNGEVSAQAVQAQNTGDGRVTDIQMTMNIQPSTTDAQPANQEIRSQGDKQPSTDAHQNEKKDTDSMLHQNPAEAKHENTNAPPNKDEVHDQIHEVSVAPTNILLEDEKTHHIEAPSPPLTNQASADPDQAIQNKEAITSTAIANPPNADAINEKPVTQPLQDVVTVEQIFSNAAPSSLFNQAPNECRGSSPEIINSSSEQDSASPKESIVSISPSITLENQKNSATTAILIPAELVKEAPPGFDDQSKEEKKEIINNISNTLPTEKPAAVAPQIQAAYHQKLVNENEIIANAASSVLFGTTFSFCEKSSPKPLTSMNVNGKEKNTPTKSSVLKRHDLIGEKEILCNAAPKELFGRQFFDKINPGQLNEEAAQANRTRVKNNKTSNSPQQKTILDTETNSVLTADNIFSKAVPPHLFGSLFSKDDSPKKLPKQPKNKLPNVQPTKSPTGNQFSGKEIIEKSVPLEVFGYPFTNDKEPQNCGELIPIRSIDEYQSQINSIVSEFSTKLKKLEKSYKESIKKAIADAPKPSSLPCCIDFLKKGKLSSAFQLSASLSPSEYLDFSREVLAQPKRIFQDYSVQPGLLVLNRLNKCMKECPAQSAPVVLSALLSINECSDIETGRFRLSIDNVLETSLRMYPQHLNDESVNIVMRKVILIAQSLLH